MWRTSLRGAVAPLPTFTDFSLCALRAHHPCGSLYNTPTPVAIRHAANTSTVEQLGMVYGPLGSPDATVLMPEHSYGDPPDKTKPRETQCPYHSATQAGTVPGLGCSMLWLWTTGSWDFQLSWSTHWWNMPTALATLCFTIFKKVCQRTRNMKFTAFNEKEIYHEHEHEVLQNC